MQLNLTRNEIIKTLDSLGIIHEDDGNKDWIPIVCVFHPDKSTGNASINVHSLVIHCFNCKQSKNLITLVREKFNISYKEAVQRISSNSVSSISNNFSKIKVEEEKKLIDTKTNFNLIDESLLEPFNPKDYYYTRVRGFTKDFCKKFNIKRCTEGIYKDYFIIPIIDTDQKIYTFEARKLAHRERLENSRYTEQDLSYYKIKKGELVSKFNNQIILNEELKYLVNKKVLYPSKSKIKETLFNIDNLKYEEDLWISEGIGSIPKIYNHISNNCTCLLGSEFSDFQILLLNNFNGRKIIIPDNDKASLLSIEALNMETKDLYVVDFIGDDKDRNFVNDISRADILKASQYLIKKHSLFDF